MSLAFPKLVPLRSKKYLAWIRTQPCIVCATTRDVEAAHTGSHGLSSKADDLRALPMCATHHRGVNGTALHHHGTSQEKFETAYNLNIREQVIAHLFRYLRQHRHDDGTASFKFE